MSGMNRKKSQFSIPDYSNRIFRDCQDKGTYPPNLGIGEGLALFFFLIGT